MKKAFLNKQLALILLLELLSLVQFTSSTHQGAFLQYPSKSLAQTSTKTHQNECNVELEVLFNESSLKNNPGQVLLGYIETYQEAIPIFCFYTGMSLISKLRELPSERTILFKDFCDHFEFGYDSRHDMTSMLFSEQSNSTNFMSLCEDYIIHQYDLESPWHDLLDQTLMLNTSQICHSLLSIFVDRQTEKDPISQIIQATYDFSIKAFISENQLIDYGRCIEIEAEQDTFCLEFFDWPVTFSLWSQDQSSNICMQLLKTMKQHQSQKDRCAQKITRVYNMYSRYLAKIIEKVSSDRLQNLNEELIKVIDEQKALDEKQQKDVGKVSEWINGTRISSDQYQHAQSLLIIRNELDQLKQRKNQVIHYLAIVSDFLTKLKNQSDIQEAFNTQQKLHQELRQYRQQQLELESKIDPKKIEQQKQSVLNFLNAISHQDEQKAILELQNYLIIRDKFEQVSAFLRRLMKIQNQDILKQSIKDEKVLDNQEKEKIFNSSDVEQLSTFIDQVIGINHKIQNDTNTSSSIINETLIKEDNEAIKRQREKVLEFLERILANKLNDTQDKNINTFLDALYKDQCVNKTTDQSSDLKDIKEQSSLTTNYTKEKLEKVKSFIESLIQQEYLSQDILKVQNFLDHIIKSEPLDHTSMIDLEDFIDDLIEDNSGVQDTQVQKVLDFLHGLEVNTKEQKKKEEILKFIYNQTDISASNTISDNKRSPIKAKKIEAKDVIKVKDLMGFIDKQMQANPRDGEKFKAIKEILSLYDLNQRSERVEDFIQNHLERSTLASQLVQMTDVSDLIQAYQRYLNMNKPAQSVEFKAESIYSSILDDFDRIKNK